MVTTDVELQLAQQLREAGKQLSHPPPSDDELLHVLDQTEKLLSKVDQSPNTMMLAALSSSMKALVEERLLKHSNVDVKITVAACLSEITRITAPDAPYTDEEMKDIFRLIVSSLENLWDTSSRSYDKKSSILETLYKVRSCVILLDLECNVLIVEMFEHFLKSVRDHHLVGSIFSWMMNIMVLVLEESEDISIYMLKPLLASIKNNTEGVLPVARKLGETVLQKSAAKLKPYLIETLRILGDSLDNYSPVLASICEGTTDVVEHNDENASVQQKTSENKLANGISNEAPQADESKLTTASSDNAAQVVRGNPEGTLLGEADATSNRSLKPVTSNGITITENEEGSADKESSKKIPETINHLDSNLTSKVNTDKSVTEKLGEVESDSVQTSNKKGKKSDPTSRSTKPSDSSHDHKNEAEKLPNNEKGCSKDVGNSSGSESSIGVVVPSETEKNTDSPVSVPKAIEGYVENAPNQSSSLPDESHVKKQVLPQKTKASLPYKRRRKGGRSKKKSLGRDNATATDIVSTEPVLAEGMSDSDMESPKGGRKKAPIAKEDKPPATVATLEDGKATSGPEAELLETSSKNVDTVDSEPIPVKKRGKKVGAGDSLAKKSKLSGKKVDGGDSEAKKPKETGKSMDAADPESVIKGNGCDSDSKPLTAKTGRKRKIITKLSGQIGNKAEGSDSDDKPLKLPAKKGNTSVVKSSSKNKSGKKLGHGKSVEEKDQEKDLSEDDGMDITLQSALKTASRENKLEEALATTSKRKRPTSKKVTETIKYDGSLVGLKVKVWWPDDKMYYDGVIKSFNSKTNKHKVLYEDSEDETLDLKDEIWEIVSGVSAHKEKAAEVQSTDDFPETPKKKKSRIDSGPSELKVSAKRAGGASLSSKAKGRGRPAKSAGSSKSKSQKSIGKSVKEAANSKEAGMSEEDVETAEIVTKNKQGNRKVVKKAVVKTPQSDKKVDADDSSKPKSSDLNVKEPENENGDGDEDEDAEETPETAKGKPSETTTKAAPKSRRKRRKRT